jgi:DNA (cytosine-5)-methyltransferase 1
MTDLVGSSLSEDRHQSSDSVVPSVIPSVGPHHQPRSLTTKERQRFRDLAAESRAAKRAAVEGRGPAPVHEINVPKFDPLALMPLKPSAGLSALSLFSGGGGLDLGFERAGFGHVASLEILEDAGATLVKARPDWDVRSGADGDVSAANWRKWRDDTAIVHGGPPCQPFSTAGRQLGAEDARNMWPAFVNCVRTTRPLAFVAENVPALASAKFSGYVQSEILDPLSARYSITMLTLKAPDFGVPQTRRRVFFVGFARKRDAQRFVEPAPTHHWPGYVDADLMPGTRRCLGVREALGLPDIGFDALAPTIRSTLTGPRHTTSILNSVAAQRTFERLQIWPNGVAPTREDARAFVARNGHFRLSVPDVALIQGFPEDWPFVGATYMKLGQIGNAVPPPLAYAVASAVSDALV